MHVKLAAGPQGNKRAPSERAFGVVAGGQRRTVFRMRISNQRKERVSLHGWWRRLPQLLENRRRQINQACDSTDTLTTKTIAGKFEDQGHVDRSVVKKNTVG